VSAPVLSVVESVEPSKDLAPHFEVSPQKSAKKRLMTSLAISPPAPPFSAHQYSEVF